MEDLIARYLELEDERKVPRRKKGNAFFSKEDDPQKTLIQKREIEEKCLESIRGVCALNLHASTEHKAHIIARQHFRSLTDEAWKHLLFWVEVMTEGLDEKYEYWMREWEHVANMAMETIDDRDYRQVYRDDNIP